MYWFVLNIDISHRFGHHAINHVANVGEGISRWEFGWLYKR